ncbi:hypothetical protein [Schaalia cardiffensis]|uniref:hypothetical protein n=1 Tax=Schaalia cardiffensis TaxID=181487 RepID=UPI0023F3A933|nr:hypothetical protein [Schaalia cardiffensis]
MADSTANATAQDTANQAPQDTQAAIPEGRATTTTEPPAAQDKPADGLPDDITQLKDIIHKLRGENAKDRTEAKTKAAEQARTDLTQQIGRALGLITDDETLTPEALTESLTKAQEDARTAKAQLAVYKAAQGRADADALLDSQAFNRKIADLDLNDANAVTKAIDDFTKENPRFKPVQAAGTSAIEHPAGSGEGAITHEQFRAMTGQQRNELHATNPDLYRTLADQA